MNFPGCLPGPPSIGDSTKCELSPRPQRKKSGEGEEGDGEWWGVKRESKEGRDRGTGGKDGWIASNNKGGSESLYSRINAVFFIRKRTSRQACYESAWNRKVIPPKNKMLITPIIGQFSHSMQSLSSNGCYVQGGPTKTEPLHCCDEAHSNPDCPKTLHIFRK